MTKTRYWLGVASADHVRRGAREGFMQVCHGKAGPLRRTSPVDGIAYYSPSRVMGVKDGLQAFTACGRLKSSEPYQFDMGGGFLPYRRDVEWIANGEAKIAPMLQVLDFTAGRTNWGQPFRYGLFEISQHDFNLIEQALHASSSNIQRIAGGDYAALNLSQFALPYI
jgi:hypothetical protein